MEPRNEYLDEFEQSEEFKQFEKEIEHGINEQAQKVLLSGAVLTAWNRLKKEFKSKMKTDDEGQPVPFEFAPKTRTRAENIVDAVLKPAFDKKSTDAMKPINLNQYYKNMANMAGKKFISELTDNAKLAQSFNLTAKDPLNLLYNRSRQLVTGLDRTGSRTMSRLIRKGFERGDDVTALTAKIQKKFKDISPARAKSIAVTETSAITEFVKYEAARENGVWVKKWVAVLDERTGNLDRQLNGEYQFTWNSFSEGVWIPPLHPNCRCTIEYQSAHSRWDLPVTLNWTDAVNKSVKDIKPKNDKVPMGWNPENVWIGGRRVGADARQFTKYRKAIVKADLKGMNSAHIKKYTKNITSLLNDLDKDTKKLYMKDSDKFHRLVTGSVYSDSSTLSVLTKSQTMLLLAAQTMSEAGFTQLARVFGYRARFDKLHKVDE